MLRTGPHVAGSERSSKYRVSEGDDVRIERRVEVLMFEALADSVMTGRIYVREVNDGGIR